MSLVATAWLALFASVFVLGPAGAQEPLPGRWQASLESPGGPLYFGLQLEQHAGQWQAWIWNGEERIAVPELRIESSGSGREVVLALPHYDAELRGTLDARGQRLQGHWSKVRGRDSIAALPFQAAYVPNFAAPATERFELPPPDGIGGRWLVHFASEQEPAVGLFEQRVDGSVLGTFLTTTGDYRFLAGNYGEGRLQLSCFDGAHAFLFSAELRPDGSLGGHFYSGDRWHDTWTAELDPAAALADPLSLVALDPKIALCDLAYPDLDGRLQPLADPRLDGQARLYVLLGSWCPNCHDEADYLAELDQRYRERGLSIVGLAFELTGDAARDALQVRRFRERHQLEFPILLAGDSNDKARAAACFPLLGAVVAYPTTVFADAQGRVRAVHSGYNGPATGVEHEQLRRHFEQTIESLLAEPGPAAGAYWPALETTAWFQDAGVGGLRWQFRRNDQGQPAVWKITVGSGLPVLHEEWAALTLGRLGLELEGEVFVPRLEAHQLWSARAQQANLRLEGQPPVRTLLQAGLKQLESRNPRLRLEAIEQLQPLASSVGLLDESTRAALLDDPDLRVRARATSWMKR